MKIMPIYTSAMKNIKTHQNKTNQLSREVETSKNKFETYRMKNKISKQENRKKKRIGTFHQ